MKKLGKKLILKKKTIDILDDKAQQNIRGGLSIGGSPKNSCMLFSCSEPEEPIVIEI